MLIFLYGQDGFRQNEKLAEIKAKFLKEVQGADMGLVVLEGEKLTLQKVSEVSGAVSMFSRKRLVVIKNFFKHKDEKQFTPAAEYLKKQADGDHIFVLIEEMEAKDKMPKYKQGFYDWCTKQPYSQAFPRLTQSELINWIKKKVETGDGQISNDALIALMALTASDLWQIDREVDKLIHYKAGSAQTKEFKIEKADVELVVQGVFTEHIFSLIDAIGERNRQRAMKFLEEELLAGQAPEQILAMIIRQYRMILSVKDAMERGMNEREVEKEMKLNSYVMKKVLGQSRHYTVTALKNIFASLIRLEQQFKTGQIDLTAGLDLLVAKL